MIRALDVLVAALGALFAADLALWWWRPEETFLALLAALSMRALLHPYPLPACGPERVGQGPEEYRYEVIRETEGYLLLRRQAARNAFRAKTG